MRWKKKTSTVADLHLTFSVDFDDDNDDDDDDNGEYYNIGNDFLSNDYNKSVKKISNNINKTE